MDLEFFNAQISRLKRVYPEHYYPNERVVLIWNAVKHLPNLWLEGAVSKFIAGQRQAPMPDMFFEEANQYEQQKQEEDGRAKVTGGELLDVLNHAASQSSNPDFAKGCIKLIGDKIAGRINKKQWHEEVIPYLEKTTTLINQGKRICSKCGGDGYLRKTTKDGYRDLYRCYCEAGRARPAKALGPRDSDGKRKEYTIPIALD